MQILSRSERKAGAHGCFGGDKALAKQAAFRHLSIEQQSVQYDA